MKLVFLKTLLTLISISPCFSHYYHGLVDEAIIVIEQRLASTLKEGISDLFDSWSLNFLEMPTSYPSNESYRLNSTKLSQVFNRRLQNLPNEVPLFPFAIAEPVAKGILVFFAEQNSTFVNLTDFECKFDKKNDSESRQWIGLRLNSKSFSLTGHYELDVSSYDLHLFGYGTYRVIFQGTVAKLNASVTTFDDNFEMSEFSTNISITKAQVSMTNLQGQDASQSLLTFIDELLPQEITLLNDMLQKTLNQTVTSFSNNVLAKVFTWSELVWFIETLVEL